MLPGGVRTLSNSSPKITWSPDATYGNQLVEGGGKWTQYLGQRLVAYRIASDGSEEAIRAATRAGVAAYVVDGLDENRIKTIVEVAVARFEERQDLRDQLEEANTKLAERKLIERAKGLLMKSRNLDEEAAFTALRKAAMDRKLKLVEVAQRIVDAADLLGA